MGTTKQATDVEKKPTAASARKMKTGFKHKKAPDAPKRFKSAFIMFSTLKHREIRAKLAEESDREAKKLTPEVAKLVAEAWKNLPQEEREEWEERARKDRERYEKEKKDYDGPWKVISSSRTKAKDPDAPKRPMSAYLVFSNGRRADVKRNDPSLSNANISKILSQQWKGMPEAERNAYIVDARKKREIFKEKVAKWKEGKKDRKEQERKIAKAGKKSSKTTSTSVPSVMSVREPQPKAASTEAAGNVDVQGMGASSLHLAAAALKTEQQNNTPNVPDGATLHAATADQVNLANRLLGATSFGGSALLLGQSQLLNFGSVPDASTNAAFLAQQQDALSKVLQQQQLLQPASLPTVAAVPALTGFGTQVSPQLLATLGLDGGSLGQASVLFGADPNFAAPMNQFPSQNLQITGIGSGINAADLSALLLRGSFASHQVSKGKDDK
mmetsp:Transcript_773/g.1207  ORF Transcript_773/g.1207 Transcript_773/m.1207 type:complete len:443 (+) Transcript_773:125-1453(+)